MKRRTLTNLTELTADQAALMDARNELLAVVQEAQQITTRINLAMVRLVDAAARVEARARYTQPEPVQITESPVLLRPDEVAEMLRISKSDVYQLHKSGRLPSVRPTGDKGRVKFRFEDVQKFARDPEAFVVCRAPIGLLARSNARERR